MSGRQTRGRQRIPIRLIENQYDLYATFSKRRNGVYKKATELSTLCGADVGIIIFSPSNHPFSFFSPAMQSVVNRYMNPNQEPSAYVRMVENHTRARIEDLNRRLDEIQERKEELKQREGYLDEIDRTRPKGWWEQVPVESLNREQLREWKAFFENLRSRVTTRIEELKNGGSSSSAIQQQNAPNFPYALAADPSAGPSIFSQSYHPHGGAYAPTTETMMVGQNPFVFGSSIDPFPTQYTYFPPQGQDPLAGGGTSHLLPQYHHHFPPQSQSPFVVGPSTEPFPTQYTYFPPQAQDPSAGGGTTQGGPSNINP